MRIGFVGLGKLGLPCALAIESRGHDIAGYDVSAKIIGNIADRKIMYREEGAQELLSKSRIEIQTLERLLAWSEIIFVAVQTPHEHQYEGTVPLPDTRKDFNYSFLQQAVARIAARLNTLQQPRTIVIVSTVLPGTIDREIRPLLNQYVRLCYNPSFIAMGTCIADLLDPEFVLLGVDDEVAAAQVEAFYHTLHGKPICRTGIPEAEAIKVFYNTFITSKIGFANTLMEMCEKLDVDVDSVTNALSMATRRLMSPAYMQAGMGDGGGCHPRDNIALSWLARRLDLSYDWFEQIMRARERQTAWLADIIAGYECPGGNVVILGRSFKPESNITTGSPALLLQHLLAERGIEASTFDPHIDRTWPEWETNTLFFVATRHEAFGRMQFPKGSRVIDPWRYVNDQDGVNVIRIGEGKRRKHVGHSQGA